MKADRIHDAFARLPDRLDAGILWLHLFDGLAFLQISERIKMNYRRIREKYRRALRVLQVELEDLL